MKFYAINSNHALNPFHARKLDDSLQISGMEDGSVKPIDDLEFGYHSGDTTLLDFIGTTNASIHLVSDRFIEVLEKFNSAGWKKVPVKLYGHDGELFQYYLLVVIGRSGKIIDNMSRKTVRPPSVPGGKASEVYMGTIFELDSWDKSDIFMIGGTRTKVVTEDLYKRMSEAELRGIKFTNINDRENIMLTLRMKREKK